MASTVVGNLQLLYTDARSISDSKFLVPTQTPKYLFVRRMISVICILSKIYSTHKLVILYIINLLVHIHTYV